MLGSKLRTYKSGPTSKGQRRKRLSPCCIGTVRDTWDQESTFHFLKAAWLKYNLFTIKGKYLKCTTDGFPQIYTSLKPLAWLREWHGYLSPSKASAAEVLVQKILSDLHSASLSGEITQTRWPESQQPCWDRLGWIIAVSDFLNFSGGMAESITLALSLLLYWFSIAAVTNCQSCWLKQREFIAALFWRLRVQEIIRTGLKSSCQAGLHFLWGL